VVSSYPPRHCGIGAYAAALTGRWREAGDTVVVISPPDGEGNVRVPFDAGRPFFRAARDGGRFDRIVVHFQPALYYRPRAPVSKVLTSLGLLWLVMRRRQTEVLVHEADPPIRWRPDYALLRQAFRRGRLLFHTDAERRELEREYRVHVQARLVDHTEGVRIAAALSRGEARRRLGIGPDERLYLCAGFLHPGKGFDRAVRAFAEAGSPGRMVVVGSVRDETPENLAHARSLAELCARTPGAELRAGYASAGEFDAWIAAADRLVLPYRVSWSSGALARARAIGTPAIVAATGGLPEQAGPGDVVFHDAAELTALLRAGDRGSDRASERVESRP
jgi:glycosyltransferase involved in cell wall biosynthesis